MTEEIQEIRIDPFNVGYTNEDGKIKIEYIALGDLLVTQDLKHDTIIKKISEKLESK